MGYSSNEKNLIEQNILADRSLNISNAYVTHMIKDYGDRMPDDKTKFVEYGTIYYAL